MYPPESRSRPLGWHLSEDPGLLDFLHETSSTEKRSRMSSVNTRLMGSGHERRRRRSWGSRWSGQYLPVSRTLTPGVSPVLLTSVSRPLLAPLRTLDLGGSLLPRRHTSVQENPRTRLCPWKRHLKPSPDPTPLCRRTFSWPRTKGGRLPGPSLLGVTQGPSERTINQSLVSFLL